MRHAVGNDDYVAFGYLMCLSAFNFGAADFVRRDLLGIDCLSTCDERGRAIDDINDISIQRVDFCLAGFDAAAGVYFVTGGFCGYAASINKLAPIEVEYFQVLHDRLILQHNKKAWDLWHKDVEGNLKKADANWPTLSQQKAP